MTERPDTDAPTVEATAVRGDDSVGATAESTAGLRPGPEPAPTFAAPRPDELPPPSTDSGPASRTENVQERAKQAGDDVRRLADEKPELLVAAAFAGGLILGLILKRLGS